MFILASASPRRRALLRQIGARFVSITPAVDEVKDAERPRDAVICNALMKARKVAEEYPEHAVLGADTAVVLNGQSFGKPKDSAEARYMLAQLEGRQHTVLTGIAWIVDGREYTDAAETIVRFAPMTEAEIAAYVARGEPRWVAGAFTIDGLGGAFITGVEGDPHNVVGLSLPLLRQILLDLGVTWPSLWRGGAEP